MRKITYILLFAVTSLHSQNIVNPYIFGSGVSSMTLPNTENFASYSEAISVFANWTNTGVGNFETELGTTPTGGTGPVNGANITTGVLEGSNQYAYYESSSAGNNTIVILESDEIDATIYDPYLTIHAHWFANTGTFNTAVWQIQGWNGSAWDIIYDFSTDYSYPFFTTDNQNWVTETADASSYTNSDFKFRIYYDTGTDLEHFRKDIAIDNLIITDGTP